MTDFNQTIGAPNGSTNNDAANGTPIGRIIPPSPGLSSVKKFFNVDVGMLSMIVWESGTYNQMILKPWYVLTRAHGIIFTSGPGLNPGQSLTLAELIYTAGIAYN